MRAPAKGRHADVGAAYTPEDAQVVDLEAGLAPRMPMRPGPLTEAPLSPWSVTPSATSPPE